MILSQLYLLSEKMLVEVPACFAALTEPEVQIDAYMMYV